MKATLLFARERALRRESSLGETLRIRQSLLGTSLGISCDSIEGIRLSREYLESARSDSRKPRGSETPRYGHGYRACQGAGREGDSRVLTHTAAAHIGARPTANSFAGSQQERVAADIHRVSANLIEGEHHAYRYIYRY